MWYGKRYLSRIISKMSLRGNQTNKTNVVTRKSKGKSKRKCKRIVNIYGKKVGTYSYMLTHVANFSQTHCLM